MLLRSLQFLLVLMVSITTTAATLDLHQEYSSPVGQQFQLLTEDTQKLSWAQALERYQRSEFQAVDQPVIGFGLGAEPVWLAVDIHNAEAVSQLRRLTLASSWLDQVEFYFVGSQQLIHSWQGGDQQPFAQRAVEGRFFSVDYHYPAGLTQVLIRVESADPMSIPLYFSTLEQAERQTVSDSLTYGLLYGAVLALLIYNLMLFFGLRGGRYLGFALYLGAFLLMNMSYTGHAYLWFWPSSPVWQQWSNPILMTLFIVFGLNFALQFLSVRQQLPRIFRAIVVFCALFLGLQFVAVLINSHVLSISSAFSFMLVFSSVMVLLGMLSLKQGNTSARYFLFAAVFGALGSTVTACAVLGYIPFNAYTFRAVEVGMLIDVALLAFALAEQFRLSEKEKAQAHYMASTDPLTALNNRRSFYEKARLLRDLGVRKNWEMSVLIFDLDGFKAINDRCGHSAGDRVLVAISEVMQSVLRSSDIGARWGGEEFIVFLSDTDEFDAASIAEALRQKIELIRVDTGQEEIAVTASFGVAQTLSAESDIDEAINRADKKLYAAKRAGRNRVVR